MRDLPVSNWKKDGRMLTMDVTVPANTTATVHVPAQDPNSVTESGARIVDAKAPALSNVEGVKFLRVENGSAVYSVSSGVYRFVSEIGGH